MNQMYIIVMLTLVGFVLTAQTAKAWPNNMIRDTYMPHVQVKTNAPPGSDESEHMIDSACENASSRVWNTTHNYTMSDDTRSKCFDHFEDYEATKYPNKIHTRTDTAVEVETSKAAVTWTHGHGEGSCVNAMHPYKVCILSCNPA